ncbi:MAG: GNAT family N-acetyltransferase [Archangium sp.]|nr:GNAT family N-acetyltransferase [Archangium sp.]
MTELTVQRHEEGHRGAFFVERDGARIAELTFTRVNPSLVIIDHTEVSDALRGQGAGRRLLDAAVAWARETKTKFIPVCPYAKAQFDKDPSIRDVLST